MKPPAKNATREQLVETYLEEILVARAPVEHLLDKHLLVGVRELNKHSRSDRVFFDTYLCNELVCVGIQSLNHGIKALDAYYCVIN